MKRFIPLLMLAVWAYVAKPDGHGYVVTKDGKPELETRTIAQAEHYVQEANKSEKNQKRVFRHKKKPAKRAAKDIG